MSKETTMTEAEVQAKASELLELSDDKLDAVSAGGYSKEDWVLILKEWERQKDGC